MQFTVGDGGKFNTAPPDQYVAKFLGITPMPTHDDKGAPLPPRIGQDGKPMAPGMAWEWEIADGPHAGKICSRITGKDVSPKNLAGRFMAAVTGKYLKPGVEINLDPCLGKLYRITVELNGQKTRVSDTPAPVPVGGEAPPANPPAAGGPPPRRTNSGKPAPAAYWVETNPDADPVKVPTGELRAFLDKNQLDARTVQICPDGGDEYKAAVDYDSSLLF